jgi:hypothetical protein
MKRIVLSAMLLMVFAMSGFPNQAQAATRTEMLQQIEALMKLITQLQEQINQQKQQPETKVWEPASDVDAKGTLKVERIQATAMRLSGVLKPPSDCDTRVQYEFILTLGKNDETKTYTPENCKELSYSETVVYTPSLVPALPSLELRFVDTANNVWMYDTQARYKIDLSNPLYPSIQALPIAGEKG